MKVKEILQEAANLIGRPDIANYIENGKTDDVTSSKSDSEILLRCYNLTENEIALEYKPLIAEKEIYAENGIIHFKDLDESALDIVSVEDEYLNKISYKIYPDYLKTAPKQVTVKYSYMPRRKKIEDDSSFSGSAVSLRIAAMGTACEFLLVSGMYEEALMWDKRYKDSLLKACRDKTAGRKMPVRSWL